MAVETIPGFYHVDSSCSVLQCHLILVELVSVANVSQHSLLSVLLVDKRTVPATINGVRVVFAHHPKVLEVLHFSRSASVPSAEFLRCKLLHSYELSDAQTGPVVE